MAASIEELAKSIEAVKENAAEADKLARQADRLAAEGGSASPQIDESMEMILRQFGAEIGEIIRVIPDIASQTNCWPECGD